VEQTGGTATDGALEDNTTTVLLTGFGLVEVPFTYGYAINDHIAVGANLKLMKGRVYGTEVIVFNKDSGVPVVTCPPIEPWCDAGANAPAPRRGVGPRPLLVGPAGRERGPVELSAGSLQSMSWSITHRPGSSGTGSDQKTSARRSKDFRRRMETRSNIPLSSRTPILG